jgi:hypothetical protein
VRRDACRLTWQLTYKSWLKVRFAPSATELLHRRATTRWVDAVEKGLENIAEQ